MYPRRLTVNDSSQIVEICYSFRDAVMSVEFMNGNIWEYTDVPAPLFGELASSASVGSTFSLVKSKLKGTRLK